MTADKNFKKLVRRRAKQTGLSYAATRQLLRRQLRRPKKVATREENLALTDQMREVISSILTPIADESAKPLDYVMGPVVFQKRDGHWDLFLYTLNPGLVIGKKGVMAQFIKSRLQEAVGDDQLRFNVMFIDHNEHVERARARAQEHAAGRESKATD